VSNLPPKLAAPATGAVAPQRLVPWNGETLFYIAATKLSNWRLWRALATENNITNPFTFETLEGSTSVERGRVSFLIDVDSAPFDVSGGVDVIEYTSTLPACMVYVTETPAAVLFHGESLETRAINLLCTLAKLDIEEAEAEGLPVKARLASYEGAAELTFQGEAFGLAFVQGWFILQPAGRLESLTLPRTA
jgi:hypothetical protein